MILVSACLLGVSCRYDGNSAASRRLVLSLADQSCLAVCPEVLGGLSIPRSPARIFGGDGMRVLDGAAFVRSDKDVDVTAQFVDGAKRTLDLALRFRVTACYLKSRSPSCGCKSYPERPVGVTAALLMHRGFPVMEM
ncbi:MAG: DUF523 domain-containing protein [Deltaproteobacteria bacterium]|nr:DUF523 domain-containing protein [Deltaproteobacteria bacterium]